MPAAEIEDRDGRIINAATAEIIRCILRGYADGTSPKAIAAALNSEGMLGSMGGTWSQSTIHGDGDRARGTGILNNEFYVGVLV